MAAHSLATGVSTKAHANIFRVSQQCSDINATHEDIDKNFNSSNVSNQKVSKMTLMWAWQRKYKNTAYSLIHVT